MLSSVFLFLDIGGPEIMLIMFVALLLFGGDKLPGLARGLGKGIRDFKDASEGVKREISNQIDNFESKKKDIVNEVEETVNGDATTQEKPLIAEYSQDNQDNTEGTTDESYLANSMPINESYVTGTDRMEFENEKDENHEHDSHVSTEPEPAKQHTNNV